MRPYTKRSHLGFTLMELLTVIVIIVIIVVIAIPALRGMKERSEKVKCTTNLKSLFVAAGGYMQDNNHWPQIPTQMMVDDYPAFAKAWVDTFRRYGLIEINWICPSVQRLMQNPDLTKRENQRIDYMPMPFDDKPTTPRMWPRHPWFVERGDVHGNGNLVIFTNGGIEEVGNIMPKTAAKP